MPASPAHHTVEANGIRQHHIEAGDGPPVILLHGFPEAAHAWHKQVLVRCRKPGAARGAMSDSVSIPRGVHLPHEERPEEVDAALLDFLGGWSG